MKIRPFARLGWLVIFLSLPMNVLAGDPPPPAAQEATAPAPTMFPKGLWTLDLTGGYSRGFGNPRRNDFYSGNVALARYWFENFAGVISVPFDFVSQTGPDTVGSGMDFLLRWNFLRSGPASVFADGGVGFLETGKGVPDGGTRFNFTERFGFGATWRINDKIFLIGGARLFHLSNAGFDGGKHNPSIAGAVQTYIGVLFRF
jgi:hypothetical protein